MMDATQAARISPLQDEARSLEDGFTLLEAIVALAIIGVTLIPLITFFGQSAAQLNMAADVNERSLAQQSAVAFLEPMNPMSEPEGSTELGNFSISWRSEAVVQPNQEVRIGTGLAGYSIGFYRVSVTLSRPGLDPWFSFETRKVGYRLLTSSLPPGVQ